MLQNQIGQFETIGAINLVQQLTDLNIATLVVHIRRELHQHPELSGQEFETAGRISRWLTAFGIPHQTGIADTGVVAILKGTSPGKTVALRADIDALPIQEENDIPYCSMVPGMMHACGHDGHTAILLCVAKVLSTMTEQLCGTVKFFFQPAEEGCGGAERMIQAGCMEHPSVDYMLGLHMAPQYEAGTIAVKYGKMMAASDEVTITVRGTSCHGAHPDLGADAILIAAHILTALQSIVGRNISPTNSAVCTFGRIEGGHAPNAIADFVTMHGILRALDAETRLFIQTRVQSIAEGVAVAMGGKAEVHYHSSYGPLINDDTIVDMVYHNAIGQLGPEHVIVEQDPDLGTEDFSYFSNAAPACFFRLGCGNRAKGIVNDLHSCQFDIDETCLLLGIHLQVKHVLLLLK